MISENKKEFNFIFRLSEEEFTMLKLLAKDLDRNMSDVIRLFLLTGYGKQELMTLPKDVGTRSTKLTRLRNHTKIETCRTER